MDGRLSEDVAILREITKIHKREIMSVWVSQEQ